MNFISDDLYPVLETDVVHSLKFLFLPHSSGWIVRIAEDEGCGLLIGTFALEVFEIYLISAVAHTFQFVFYYFAAAVCNAGEEAVVDTQAVAVPTAVLSTHTGGLGTPAKLANPGYGPAALEHYRRLGLRFDCIYSGYLADASQAKLVEHALDLWPDALTVVDPVMGDHGRMYRGLAPEMVPAMYTLCSRASLILPNTTEAALLLGDPMPGVTGEAELHTAQAQAQRLTRICPRVLITGVAAGRGIACVGADRATGESLVRTPMVPKSFHGTGDIFGAVLVGRLLQGNVLPAAAQAAAVFVADCLKATPDEADERLGVWLESVLPQLMQNPE